MKTDIEISNETQLKNEKVEAFRNQKYSLKEIML